MRIEIISAGMKLKELKDALKSSSDTEIVLITTDNKAVKIANARAIEIPINTLKKLG